MAGKIQGIGNLYNFKGLGFPGYNYQIQQSAPSAQNLSLNMNTPASLKQAQAPIESNNFFGGIGGGIMGGALQAGGTQMGSYKRGVYDMADPLYHLSGNNRNVVGEGLSDAGVGMFQAGAQSGNGMLMLAGGITKGVGSLVNAAFGTSVDKEKLAEAQAGTNALRSYNSNARSFDDVKGPMTFANVRNAYDSGWFNPGWSSRRNKRLKQARAEAEKWADRSVDNNINNIMNDQVSTGLANYSAFGGPLQQVPFQPMTGEATTYNFMSDYLTMKNRQVDTKNSNAFNYPTWGGVSDNVFADGGGIHIKHPGRLTELKKRTGKTEAELWAEGRPDVRKMITFARNARKWNKALGGYLDARDNLLAFGGDLQTNGSDFPSGLTHIGAGLSHEENPYGGVQMGVDKQNIPNYVEQNEVIWDDYVFSDRIPCDEETKKKFHINKKRDMTYADLAKKLEKEITERPNDPVSIAGFKAQMEDLQECQERQKQEMEAERAKAAFEALPPEEQVAMMNRANQEEQMAQAAMQEQAIAQQQAAMEQPQVSPEEAAMAEQQMMQQAPEAPMEVPQEEMAYGGKLYDGGGELDKKWYNGLTSDYKWIADTFGLKNAEDLRNFNRGGFADNLVGLRKYSSNPKYKDIPLNALNSNRAINEDLWNALANKGYGKSVFSTLTPEQLKEVYDDYLTGYNDFTAKYPYIPYAMRMNEDFRRQWDEGYEGYQSGEYNNGVPTRMQEVEIKPSAPVVNQNTDDNLFVRNESDLEALASVAPLDVSQIESKAAVPSDAAPVATVAPMQIKVPETLEDASVNGGNGKEDEVKFKVNPLRYAGLLGPAVSLGMMAAGVGKPDYSRLDAAVEGMGEAATADWKPIGNYLTYRPMDIWYEQNRLNANARATDRAIMNNASPIGTKMAGLLANGYNNQIASGNLYRQALEYNDAQKARVEDFNRGTNQFNAQAFNQNSQFNANAYNAHKQAKARLGLAAAQQRLDSDAGWYNSLYGNVNNLFKGMGNLGTDLTYDDWIRELAKSGMFHTKAKGGKIRKKRKSGLTY